MIRKYLSFFSFWPVIYLLKPSSFQRNDQKKIAFVVAMDVDEHSIPPLASANSQLQ
jgi:hypothetical protein